jgi:acetyltransferase-like isoleucine patch superfamily enzyme
MFNVDITSTKPSSKPALRGRHILRALGLMARGHLPVGLTALAHWTVALSRHPRVTWGSQSLIGPGVILDTNYGGSIRFGRKVTLYPGVKICTYGGKVELGDNVAINYHTVILGSGAVVIGRDTVIAPNVVIAAGNHGYQADRLIRDQPYVGRGITIEEDCWICANAVITDGVTVGRGTVVAAGAVVTKDTQPYSIVGGTPAKVIGQRPRAETAANG